MTLTKPQQVYKARAAIAEWMGLYESISGYPISTLLSDHGELKESDDVPQDMIDGYTLALEDLDKATVVMEEAAAFGYLMEQLQEQHPETQRSQLQKAARSLVADPDTRTNAAIASGVYGKMGMSE